MNQPPVNLEAECGIIGRILANNSLIEDTAELSPSMFFSEYHRQIFKAAQELNQQGRSVDIITLSEKLEEIPSPEDGWIAYLATIQNNTPTTSIHAYINIVKEKSASRALMCIGEKITKLAAEGRSPQEKQAEAMQMLETLSTSAAPDSTEISAHQAIENAIQKFDDRLKRAGELGGLSTGVKALDKMLDGLRPGELIIIGGRPSMGKSCLGESISRAAARQHKAVRFHSYEMPAADLMLRASAASQSISFEKIRKGEKLNQEDYSKFSAFVSSSHQWNLIIDEDTSANVDAIALRAIRQKRKTGLDILIIDHLHLMPIKGENRAQALGVVSARLKRLARELKIPVVLLAQLNRESAKGGNPRKPTLADLRDSGSIEQDADVVILLHRPGYYSDSANQGEAELIIAKHRNGPVGTVAAGWDGRYVRFQDRPPTDWSPAPRYTVDSEEEDI